MEADESLPDRASTERFENLPASEQELVRTTGRQLLSYASSYAASVAIGDRETGSLLSTASAVLVRLGNQLVAVTADHVVRAFEQKAVETCAAE